jgi:hypothetical protein
MRGWVVAIGLVSCGVTYVKGPDGNNDWFKVACRREAVCMKKAATTCPSGFLLAESQTGSSTFYSSAPSGDQEDNEGKLRDMFARCGSEKEEVRKDDDDEPFKPIAKQKDLSGCGRMYEKIDELAAEWIEWHPSAESADARPTRSEFIGVCGDLPETAQFCLSVKYEKTHQDECADAFEDLPAKTRVRLARLFEKDGDNPATMVRPPPAIVDSGAPTDAALEGGKKDAGAPKPVKDAGAPKPTPDAGAQTDAGKKGAADAAAE